MRSSNKFLALMIILVLASLSCGVLNLGIENANTSPTIEAILEGEPAATQPPAPTETPPQPTTAETNAESQTGDANEPPSQTDEFDCDNQVEELDLVTCNIIDSFRSRNLSALTSYMLDPFVIGYWRSEWTDVSPDYALSYFLDNTLPADPSSLTFTADREQFPELMGIPVDNMLGPDVTIARILFSQGWGEEGQGEILLFITQEPDGRYVFFGVLSACCVPFDSTY